MLESKFNIDHNLPVYVTQLIEAFVAFYGEDKREEITHKFNNIVTIGYLRFDDYSSIINDACKEIMQESIKKFFEYLEIDYDAELAKKLFGSGYSFKSGMLADYFNYRGRDSEYYRNFILKCVRNFIGVQSIQMGTPEYDEIHRILDSYEDAFNKAKAYEQAEFDKRYGKYETYFGQLKQLKDKTNKKYFNMYLNIIKQYLSESDQKKLAKGDLYSYMTLEDANLLVGYTDSITCRPSIDAFTSETEKILHDPDAKDWRKDSIKRDRITYFNHKGINLGDDYEVYKTNSECLAIWPQAPFADMISSLRINLEHKATEEMLLAMPHLAEAKKRLESTDLLNRGVDFLSSIICGRICISPNYKYENGVLVPNPVLFINGNCDKASFDCTLIHEFNHIFELQLLDFDGKTFRSICGWDITEDEIQQEEEVCHEDSKEKRPYEMLNEAVNELIAQEISKLMHSNGNYLMSSPENAVDTSRSSYSKLFFLVKDFFFEFKDVIIASRSGNNIQKLFDVVGQENFEELNRLCYDYEKRFSGMSIYRLYNSLKEGIDDEDTRYYRQCAEKKNDILRRMRAYSLENVPSIA